MPQMEWTWQPEGLLEAEPCHSPAASLTPGDPGDASSPRPLLASSKCLGPSGPEPSRGSTALRVKSKTLTVPQAPANPAPSLFPLHSSSLPSLQPWPTGWSSETPGSCPPQGLCTRHVLSLGLPYPDLRIPSHLRGCLLLRGSQ